MGSFAFKNGYPDADSAERLRDLRTLYRGAEGKMNGLTYKDRITEQSHHLEMAGVFVQIGLLPNTDFVKETQPPIALSKFREIEINPRCKTSVPGIFAAGDCTTVPYKQIIISMGEGSKAAPSAFDHLIRHSVAG